MLSYKRHISKRFPHVSTPMWIIDNRTNPLQLSISRPIVSSHDPKNRSFDQHSSTFVCTRRMRSDDLLSQRHGSVTAPPISPSRAAASTVAMLSCFLLCLPAMAHLASSRTLQSPLLLLPLQAITPSITVKPAYSRVQYLCTWNIRSPKLIR